jgi:glycosyltransferase involved in cell wall biosynthesis
VTRWAILTGEYPPDPGGVSDYTRLVARGLADAGDSVRVYTPAGANAPVRDPGVEVLQLPGRFGPRSLAALDRLLLARPRADRILVQYVPQAFGWKGMNVALAVWLAARAPRIAPVWVMFHEVATPFAWRPVKHAVLGAATRAMARLVAGAADRVLVSIPAWGGFLKRLCPRGRSPEWLPVPCTLDTNTSPTAIAAARARVAPGSPLVGHFGTFGDLVAALLAPTLTELVRLAPAVAVLLIGRGSERFAEQFLAVKPELRGRVVATGELPADEVAAHLRACDVLVQPFLDGISSRRTTAMAGLATGASVATNLGYLSEPVWNQGAVATVPTPDPAALARLAASLLDDRAAREELGRRALALYRDTFALKNTILRLREAGG